MSHRAGLDQATVVGAAVELINREGVAALSLKRLADVLGVQTPSLYNHIAGLPDNTGGKFLSSSQLISPAPVGRAHPHGRTGPCAQAATDAQIRVDQGHHLRMPTI